MRALWSWITRPQSEKDKEVLQFQLKYKSPVLKTLAQCASFLSDEEFYLLSFPVVIWGPLCEGGLFSPFAVAQFLGWNLSIGSTVKNLVGYRRPTSPPVHRSDDGCEAIEFGMPSTHAFMSVCFAMHVATAVLSLISSPTIFDYILWISYVLVWSISISLSRVYLGYHTFQDIVVGWTTGIMWFFIMEFYILPFLFWRIMAVDYVVLCGMLIFWLSWLLFHPFNKSSKEAFLLSEGTFDYSPPIMAVGLFSSLCLFRTNTLNVCTGTSYTLLMRYVVGIPMLAAVYFGSRYILPHIVEPILKYCNVDAHYIPYGKFRNYIVENLKKPQTNTNEKCKKAWVRIICKFLQYAFVTIAVSHVELWLYIEKTNEN